MRGIAGMGSSEAVQGSWTSSRRQQERQDHASGNAGARSHQYQGRCARRYCNSTAVVTRSSVAAAGAGAGAASAAAAGVATSAAQVVQGGAGLVQVALSSVDPAILKATCAASFKLFALCGAVGLLLRSGRIPKDTAPVLSKVAFNLTIPCMLMVKLARTLTTNYQPSLVFVPITALLQVACGAVLGLAGALLLELWYRSRGCASTGEPLRSDTTALSEAIAGSTAVAIGSPKMAPYLLPPRPRQPPAGLRELCTICCGFGNSLTLPLVFLLTLLPAAAADSATGYCALFLLGWSPCFWTLGYQTLALVPSSADAGRAPPPPPPSSAPSRPDLEGLPWYASLPSIDLSPLWRGLRPAAAPPRAQPPATDADVEVRASAAPPADGADAASATYDVVPGEWSVSVEDVDDFHPPAAAEAATRAQRACAAADRGAAAGGASADGGSAFALRYAGGHLGFPGSAAPPGGGGGGGAAAAAAALQPPGEALSRAWAAAAALLQRVVNPPLIGVGMGLLLAATPLRMLLQQPGAGGTLDALLHVLPWELRMVVGALQSCVDVATVLGSATLAIQGIVLGASLFKPAERRKADAADGMAAGLSEPAHHAAGKLAPGPLAVARRWLRSLLPDDPQDAGLLLVVSVVRLLLMPLVGLAVLHAMRPLLPQDPVCHLLLLVQAAMPPAQNLVLLVQLRDDTKHLAPRLAGLLLRVYALAAVPLTLWVAVFLQQVSGSALL